MNYKSFKKIKFSFSNVIFSLLLILLFIVPFTLGVDINQNEGTYVFSWLSHSETAETKWTSDRKTIYVQSLEGENVISFLPLINLHYYNLSLEEDYNYYAIWKYRHADNPEEVLQELTDKTKLEEGKYYFVATLGSELLINNDNVVEIKSSRELYFNSLPEEQRSITIEVKKSDVIPTNPVIQFIDKGRTARTNYAKGNNTIAQTNGKVLMGSKKTDTKDMVPAYLPLISIDYINPDIPEGQSAKSATHFHYAVWYYRDANKPYEKLKELTNDTELEPGEYYFVAIPGEGATIEPREGAELEDYTRIYYDDYWSESERSLNILIVGQDWVKAKEWKWRYTYDYSVPSSFFYHLDQSYKDAEPYPEELKTIYTTNKEGAVGSVIKNSLPGFTLNYENPEIGDSFSTWHWHNVMWYYRSANNPNESLKKLNDDTLLKEGEYVFVAEIAESVTAHHDNGLENYSRLLPYPFEANEEKRTLNIKIKNYDEKVEVSELKWIDSEKSKLELDYFSANPLNIYSQNNVSGNNYLFNGSVISDKLPNFSVRYTNIENSYDIFRNHKVDYIHKAIWQYRKKGEPATSNQFFNGEDFTLLCDENNFCGDYIFTATIGDGNSQDAIDSSFLNLSEFLNSNSDLFSLTISFYYGDYFSGNIVQSANDSYDLTLNMFDYWLTAQNDQDVNNPDKLWEYGINKNHALLFANYPSSELGWVNNSSGAGVVQSLLDANGNPVLNPKIVNLEGLSWAEGRDTSESLDYLFDPTVSHDGKATYTNVKGLFQKDEKGYYYYDYKENSASFQRDEKGQILKDGATINLYNRPIISNEGDPLGEFYPFNNVLQFFDENGYPKNFSKRDVFVNHYFGLTLEVPFRQASDGKMILPDGTSEDMIFEFSGDDDVWVFIDDVLVLDIGGLGVGKGYINFSTGDVVDQTGEKSLKSIFDEVKKNDVLWKGKTFADNTTHTLKMFYMERANGASTLQVRFNLQPLSSNKVKKVDFDNKPLKGVEFDLYESDENGKKSKLVASMVTNDRGEAIFRDENGKNFNFENRHKDFYLLEERTTIEGYRPSLEKIILKYDITSNSLSVVSPYITGVTTTFDLNVKGNINIRYKQYDSESDELNIIDEYLNEDDFDNGLILAVPMIKKDDKWIGLYLNDQNGYSAVECIDNDIRKTILKSALYQIYYNESSTWKISWDESKGIEGGVDSLLLDLPGSADRHIEYNENGDMRLEYIVIPESILTYLRIKENTTEVFHDVIKNVKSRNSESLENVISKTIEDIIFLSGNDSQDFIFIDLGVVEKIYNTTVTIPNKERELKVQKVDTKGNLVAGAKFSIFGSLEDAEAERNALATGITDDNGMLSFKVSGGTGSNNIGTARMKWPSTKVDSKYYLKEIEIKNGYVINDTIISIIVDKYSIYADAGTMNDDVAVIVQPGRLSYNMRRYATSGNINVTLKDVEVAFQNIDGTGNLLRESNQYLHYKSDNNGYYESDEEGFIKVDSGYATVKVFQDFDYSNENGQFKDKIDNDDSDKNDLSEIFSVFNTVEVANQKQDRKISGIAFEDLNKNDEYDEKDVLLSGIEVSLIYKDKVITTKTNKDGYYEFNNLQRSEYSLKFELPELSSVIAKGDKNNSNKADYKGVIDSIKFARTDEDEQYIKHVNLGIRSANFIFTKIEANDELKIIKNAGLFALYKYDEKECGDNIEAYANKLVNEETKCFIQYGKSVSTDDNGEVKFLALKEGTYRFVEEEAPGGFVRPSGEWNVTIAKKDDKISMVIECVGGEGRTCPAFKKGKDEELYLPNVKIATMPNSGGIGQIIFVIFGIIVMNIGLIYLRNPEFRSFEKIIRTK